MNAYSTVVIVPYSGHIEPACEKSLRDLERRGYTVWRVLGYSQIDQARNDLATQALKEGFEETIWIDSDIGFQADDVETLRSNDLPIACVLYPKKGSRALASHMLPGTDEITFGKNGGLLEIKYAAAGFLQVKRRVYEEVQKRLKLPTCNKQFGKPMIPFFQPLIVQEGNESWYLGEDFAFCDRARQCGFKIMADTRIRLHHFGSYGYSWEEAGADPKRYENYTYHLS